MKYTRNQLVNELEFKIKNVKFIKHNGDERIMRCTLQKDYLPESNNGITQHDDLIVVWDLDKKDWRSFNVSSVLDVW